MEESKVDQLHMHIISKKLDRCLDEGRIWQPPKHSYKHPHIPLHLLSRLHFVSNAEDLHHLSGPLGTQQSSVGVESYPSRSILPRETKHFGGTMAPVGFMNIDEMVGETEQTLVTARIKICILTLLGLDMIFTH